MTSTTASGSNTDGNVISGSLTPLSRSEETVQAANTEGLINGLLTLLPSVAMVTLLVRNNVTFAKRTNFQSRTAIAIMPAFFVATLTSELYLSHRMRQMAIEAQHGTETVRWAEQQLSTQQQQEELQGSNNATTTQQLTSLYQKSVESTGLRVIPGALQWHHHVANYTAQYPFRVLAAVAVPSVGYIFYGRTEQHHLQFSQKLMHTRVLGQFATISLLLTVMGFKEYMDQNGRYISQEQADDRINEMHQVRQKFLYKMEQDKQHAAELKAELERAHDEDDANRKKKKAMRQKVKKTVESMTATVTNEGIVDAIATTKNSSNIATATNEAN